LLANVYKESTMYNTFQKCFWSEMKKELPFKKSLELKKSFIELADKWCRKHRLDLPDLAERCGVSMQYLSHISRYGRIPSKPILTLLALNLELKDPAELFRIAELSDPWPYERGMAIRPASATESGLLSVNLDLNGFAEVIRDMVRTELQPKRFDHLLGKRALRVGLNRGQFFLFNNQKGHKDEGFFPDLLQSLALALHCKLEFIEINHTEFEEKLSLGQIDCYGPIYRTAPRLSSSLYSKAFCMVPVAAAFRVKKSALLKELPTPKKISDLRRKDYVIAVHEDSMAHHYAESVLGIGKDRIIPCQLPEEALERIMLTNIPRPAHLVLSDQPFIKKAIKQHNTAITELFSKGDSEAEPFEDAIAIRPDWPELLAIVDQSLDFMQKAGALKRIFEKYSTELGEINVS
jgi:ABC-type amino acid transport substrate-binding protein